MKTIAKFLTGLTIAVMLFCLYYVLSSRLYIDARATVTPASQNTRAFQQAALDAQAGKYEGITALDTIDAYTFVTIDVSARNYSLFTAEWAQFVPKAIAGDVLIVTSDTGPKDIPSFKADEFSVMILTKSADAARGGWLEYYIFGRFHSLQAMPD